MAAISTFYLSQIIGSKFIDENREVLGKLVEVVVDDVNFIRPRVVAIRAKIAGELRTIDFTHVAITKDGHNYRAVCSQLVDIEVSKENTLLLAKHILDKQIVDVDGKKLVRVNDIRLAVLSTGTYLVAVDVGIEGLLRRLGIDKPIRRFLRLFGSSVPGELILWDEVETISFSNMDIKLSKTYTKLSTMHPSDLADILEELDRRTQMAVFSSLDEEKAADVLEELESDAQKNVLESLQVPKAADILEKMPSDEVADILDELEDEKAEELLEEMEDESSEEVRDLMEYPDNVVGSVMTTDFIYFHPGMTVDETITELRRLKPEADTLYYLYVLDSKNRLVAAVSIFDFIVAESDTRLSQLMDKNVIFVHDYSKLDSLAQILSKYNLLAVPVIDKERTMLGMVIIDDVITELIKTRRRRL